MINSFVLLIILIIITVLLIYQLLFVIYSDVFSVWKVEDWAMKGVILLELLY